MNAKPAKALERSPRPVVTPRPAPPPRATAPPRPEDERDKTRGMSNAAISATARTAPAAAPPAAQVVKVPRKGASNAKVSLAAKTQHPAERVGSPTHPASKGTLSTETRHAAAGAAKTGLGAVHDKTKKQAAAAPKPAAHGKAKPAAQRAAKTSKASKASPSKAPPRHGKTPPAKHAAAAHPAGKKAAHPAVASKKRAAPRAPKPVLRLSRLAMPTAASAGARRVLDKLGAAATAARQRFADRTAKATASIAARAEQTHRSIEAAGTRQAGQLQGAHRSARAQMDSSVASLQAQTQADGARHEGAVTQSHTTSAAQARSTFAEKQQGARKLGTTFSQRAGATADDVAGQMNTTVAQRAQQARDIGRSMAQRGSPPEVAEAKRKVAQDISEDTAGKVSEGVDDSAEKIRGTVPESSQTFEDNAETLATQLGSGQDGLLGQLDTLSTQTKGGIQQAVAGTVQSLGHAKQDAAAQIAAAEQQSVGGLHDGVAHTVEQTNQAADHAASALNAQASKTIAAGDAQIGALAQVVAAANIPEDKSAELSQKIAANVTTGFQTTESQLDNSANAVGDKFSGAGARMVAATDTATGTVTQRTQGSTGRAVGKLGAQRQQVSAQLGTVATKANAAGTNAVTQTATSLDASLDQASQTFTEGITQYRGFLGEQVNGADTKAVEPVNTLTNRIDEAQQRAATRSERSWWSNQWHDFVDMLSDPGFWAGLIVGLLVLVLVLMVIGTGGTALIIAGVIAGAAAGFAGSVVGQASGHSFSPSKWGQPVDWGQAGMAALLGGAAGGVLALIAVGAGAGAVALGLFETASAFMLSGWGIATMAVATSLIGVATNYLTGQDLDKGLLANLFLGALLAWASKFLPIPGRPIDPVEPTPLPGRTNERVPGVAEVIDPAVQPGGGWKFVDTPPTVSGDETIVKTDVTAPDGSSGWVVRGYNPKTNTFFMHKAFLDAIKNRWIPTQPEMVKGQGTPLETYMTIRQMKILRDQASAGNPAFTGPRTQVLTTIINARTILEYSAGTPIENTASVRYANNSIQQTGGRIIGARVKGGSNTAAKDIYVSRETLVEEKVATLEEMCVKYGVSPTKQVLQGFNIELDVIPADAPLPTAKPGVPVPVVPSNQGDNKQP